MPDAPPELLERDAPRRIDAHTFALEANALREAGACARARKAQLALRVDHAMPRNSSPVAQCAQRVADQACLAVETRESRDGSVGRHASCRNFSHDRIDAIVRAFFGYHTGAGVRRRGRGTTAARDPSRS